MLNLKKLKKAGTQTHNFWQLWCIQSPG